MNLDRILPAVRTRHRGGAEEGAELDLGERNLDDSDDLHIGRQVQLDVVAAARLDHEQVAIDTFDGAAHPRRCRRLLGNGAKDRCSYHRRGDQRTGKRRTDYGHRGSSSVCGTLPGHPDSSMMVLLTTARSAKVVAGFASDRAPK